MHQKSKIKIVLVEDNEIVRTSLAQILSAQEDMMVIAQQPTDWKEYNCLKMIRTLESGERRHRPGNR